VFDAKHTAHGHLLGPVVKSGSLTAFMISPQSDEALVFRAPFLTQGFITVTLLSDLPVDIDVVSLRFNLNSYCAIYKARLFETGDEVLFHGAEIIIAFDTCELVESLYIQYSNTHGSILYLQSIKTTDQEPVTPTAMRHINNTKITDIDGSPIPIQGERLISSAVLMYKSKNYSASLDLYLRARELYGFKSLDIVIEACKSKISGVSHL
jgi:hypothetical protein